MLVPMTRTWLGGAVGLAIACGPTVPTDTPTGGNEESSDTESTGSMDTGGTEPDPATTMLPTTTTSSRLDVGAPDGRIDATYLLAVATVVDPAHPLQYVAQTRLSDGMLDLVLVPLSLAAASTTSPRLPHGEPLVYSNIAVEGGCFFLDMGEVFVAGETNPITGSDMTAAIVLDGCFEDASYCGTIDGEVIMPIALSLTGSTFAAIEADPQMLPVDFPSAC
jgi:hypothetical protein